MCIVQCLFVLHNKIKQVWGSPSSEH